MKEEPVATDRGLALADICIRRPVFATMLNLFLVVLGWISFLELGVDSFPNVDIPTITVTATLPGASPEEMETSVTKPLEEIINTVEGIDELSSKTTEGVARITVNFLFTRSRDAAAQDVRDKVNSILSQLPPNTNSPIIDKFDTDASPVLTICVSSPRSLKELTFIAEKQIKEILETVPDVGAVNLVGDRRRAVQVAVDIDRLRAYGLAIDDIRMALVQENVEIPGGRLDQQTRELTLRTLGRMQRVADFGDLHVGVRSGVPIQLKDVATVTDSVEEPRSLSRLNGENALSVVVRKQSGSNTVDLIHGVKQRLAELEEALPRDLKLTIIRDQSRFIQRSLDEVSIHLLLGAMLVALTVFFFLHDWRGTLIASIAIPASIVTTFALMRALDFTLNNFTMLGLVFAVGIVVDDAIVVIENIHRTIEEKRLDSLTAARVATKEIALAVLATTLSLVVIFLPVAFMSGRVGRFFSSYGITVAFAILVSLFVSFTLTPMLASRFLKSAGDERTRERRAHGGRLMTALTARYSAILAWSLRHRWVVVLAAAATTASLGALVPLSQFNYMPQDDSSEFEVVLEAPEGTSLSAADKTATEMEARLKTLQIDGQPVVLDTLTNIGETSGRIGKGEGNVTHVSIYCRLPELGGFVSTALGRARRWSQFEAMNQTRRILAAYPDYRVSVQRVSGISSGGSRNAEFEFNLVGPDLGRLAEYAEQIMGRLRGVKGIVDLDTTLSNRNPEVQVRIDREKANQFGISVQQVARGLRTAVGGEIVSNYKEADDQFDVWLRASRPYRSTAEAVEQIAVRARGPDAETFITPLSNFVSLVEARGPSQIDRYQRQRKVTVVANLQGIALSDAIREARAIGAELNMPPEYRIVFTGRAKTLAETFANFLRAFVLALIFMYMILAAQFENFVHPISILLAVPLSLPFALLTMIVLREPLNIYAIFGMFMLFGVVKKNGILQVDYTNTLRARGMEREEAILTANRVRLRPILMTTILLVASMIPIALGTGPGSAGRASMAKIIIGGQMLCLLLTLLVTPVTYSIFDDWSRGRFWRRRAGPISTEGNGGNEDRVTVPSVDLVEPPGR
ncbi:MAG TPA: efflux RND transporter permease subunit [Chthoniobacteraceae bacterium]|nr:efflux RND transporter permease subunit [Chthoniobacteraceae bacterium]